MDRGAFSNLTDQVTDLLRDGMLSGRWRGSLPGRDRLAGELGVSHRTVEEAMRRLAKEDLLVSQGAGRRRRIVLPVGKFLPRHLRVRILAYDSTDRNAPNFIDLLARLNRAGFATQFAARNLMDLGMNAKRVARFVQQVPADAWSVLAGSREVLEWFSSQPLPTYALFVEGGTIGPAPKENRDGCQIRSPMPPEFPPQPGG